MFSKIIVRAGLVVAIASCSSARKETSPFAYIFRGTQQSRERAIRIQAESEISRCMKRAGFQYKPNVPPAPKNILPPIEPGHTSEWKRSYGYGIAYGLTNLKIVGDHPNPNDIIYSGLSDADRNAYDRAYVGIEPSDVRNSSPTTGCAPIAYIGFGTSQGIARATLGSKRAELQSRVKADREVAEARGLWRKCMSTSGYPASDDDDLVSRYLAQLRPIGPPSDEEINRILVKEREIAFIDASCSEQADLDAVQGRVQAAMEATFIERNAELIQTANLPQ